MTHQRRACGRTGATVTFDEDMPVTMKKEEFLANSTNKQQFINMLSGHLQKNTCQTFHAPGDADLLIVQKAVESATTRNTVLIGDDTDLLILLIYHTNLDTHDLLFKPEPATTSRLYGIGKGAAIKKLITSNVFRLQATVFGTSSASTADVVAAGENALVCLYNGKPGEGLNSLRYNRFCEKVATSSSYVQLQSLPPTSAAAKYHSLRVYYQVQQWKGTVNNLLPQDWGWKESDGLLFPVQTDLPPASQELLQVIRCSCKTDCSNLRCTCKKHNIECSVVCSNCKGSGCANSFQETECENSEFDDHENSD
ncbi:uncharacterized protein LOC128222459 isoform X1 [Mya arenaria]|uniref:uncharacterized protein LOC128222459 isoform X1 n=1 Tax=Mya arenaria TaxID=6604 RepID=UPI0022E2258C|nr:uncharacterized protein LOC128222459 isoform X1 [Mya arenaria]